ncbi:Alpha-beta hydrolase fold protein [Salinisphaera shabanensis E1L3A]|uniref:Alpha-beta hydrolase fold protein n=1 Tax=Salinisphaera shabanensis E1L3A TaxID=1033802 RepID=U2FR31_9GAMM|nr:alpha/beta fold hydrolase [Salinisphaera shabanensis]ERJ18529.1 Alpha-beta hydrolase fold protein [Salinisphaera shabanensis E1L3A]
MRETPLIFGHESHLVGILCEPDEPARKERPALMFLNAGLEHRVGPRGLSVAVARALADAGFASLRFDYAGMGESRKPQSPLAVERRDELQVECAAAIELLHERVGCSRVVLFGLCSGADDAHHVALSQSAVAGMIQIDGHAAITAGFKWRYIAQRLSSPRRWQNWFERKFGTPSDTDHAVIEGIDFFEMPDRDTLAGDLSTLVARDVRLFYAYSGATHGYYNHAGQLRNALADIELGDHLHEQFLPSADHTFSRNAERMRLIEAVIGWLQSGWPVAE